jgi:phosphoglycerate kinase
MIKKLTLNQLNLNKKKVLMRVDFNVPMTEQEKIVDDTRIRATLPSIKYITHNEGSVILMSHLGRPKGKKNSKLSLAPCAKRLEELLGQKVIMATESVGASIETLIEQLTPGSVLLLENMRFYPEEENPNIDPSFAKKLASYGDIYVNDAFGTAHRKHSSTTKITEFFPECSVAGFLMEKEILFLEKTLIKPQRPFYAIIGGAKVSTKLGILRTLLQKSDGIIIGGGMVFTFLKSMGINIGSSLVEDECLEEAKHILRLAQKEKKPFLLPPDLVIGDKFSNDATSFIQSSQKDIPEGSLGMDIGPESISLFGKFCTNASSIFWNGPLGVVEFSQFTKGTHAIAQILADLEILTVVGGGDSIAAINSMGLQQGFSHLSTGGGATLEYIEYGSLPGIEALTTNPLLQV